MTVQICDVAPTLDGYAMWASIYNCTCPAIWGPVDPEEMVRLSASRDPRHYIRRTLAVLDGAPIGCGITKHLETLYHPQKLWIWAGVLPAHRRQGVGSALVDDLFASIEHLDPRCWMSSAVEPDTATCRFLEGHGFGAEERFAHSILAIDALPLELERSALARTKRAGVEICTLAALSKRGIQDWEQKLWRLTCDIEALMPSQHEITEISFERFQTSIMQAPDMCWEETMVALSAADEMVGLSSMWRDRSDNTARQTGLTGVTRTWQRQGIATALKVRVLQAVRQNGGLTVSTQNMDHNPMLDINKALGFEEQPAMLSYVRGTVPGIAPFHRDE